MPNRFFLLLLLSLLLLAGGCNSTNEHADKTSKDIYVSYSEEGIGKTFSVPPGIVSVFLDESKVGNTELKLLLEDIRHLNFLIIPNLSSDVDNNHYADINKRLEDILFQDLASINNGAELIRVKILPKDSVAISEMIVLVSNEQSLFCVSFQGDINLTKVANLVKPENLEVVTNLNRFN
jgi:hypothetical protein